MAVLRATSSIATALLALLLLPRPVTAVPHNHGHKHMHRHVSSTNDPITLGPESLARRDTPVNLGDQERMDKEAVETMRIKPKCDPGDWPLASGVPMPIKESGPPAQLDFFPIPESTPNALTMHNYCSYDLYFNGGAPEDSAGTKLAAGGSVSRPLTGSVMKVSKSKSLHWPFLIEYGGGFYDMSLITCLGTTDGLELFDDVNNPKYQTITTDTSRCPGHEAGLHLSQPKGPTFQCKDGLWCDGQAYFYEVSQQV